MAEQDLRLTVSADGAPETAQQLKGVADAQAQITQGQAAVAAPTQAAAEATEQAAQAAEKLGEGFYKAGASQRDMVSLLSRISPGLGQFADSAFKAFKVLGDLSTEQISLTSLAGRATEAIKANSSALLLLGAGGAAFVGIQLLLSTWQQMKEELDKVNQRLERQRDLMNELRNEAREQQRGIEGISDTRREGGFTADQARQAQALAARIQSRFGQLDPAAVEKAVANLFGTGLGAGEIEQAAFLVDSDRLELNPRASALSRRGAAERAIRRNQQAIGAFFGREQQQAREDVAQARTEANTDAGGSTVAIEEVIRQALGDLPQEDIQTLIEELRKFPTRGDLSKADVRDDPIERFLTRIVGSPVTTPELAQQLERIYQILETQRTVPSTVTINDNRAYPNQKNYGPDVQSQERRRLNGQTRAAVLEN